MKPSGISAEVLFQDHLKKFNWTWVAGQSVPERVFNEVAVRKARASADLIGYLNYIHPYRAQVLGEREVAYLSEGSDGDCIRRLPRTRADLARARLCGR